MFGEGSGRTCGEMGGGGGGRFTGCIPIPESLVGKAADFFGMPRGREEEEEEVEEGGAEWLIVRGCDPEAEWGRGESLSFTLSSFSVPSLEETF